MRRSIDRERDAVFETRPVICTVRPLSVFFSSFVCRSGQNYNWENAPRKNCVRYPCKAPPLPSADVLGICKGRPVVLHRVTPGNNVLRTWVFQLSAMEMCARKTHHTQSNQTSKQMKSYLIAKQKHLKKHYCLVLIAAQVEDND